MAETVAKEARSRNAPNTMLVSSSKRRLTERDLLMMCVDDPKYLSRALGHDVSIEGGTGLETLEQKKEMLKYFYKAWSGLAKYIHQQCYEKNLCVDFPLVGRFMSRQVTEGGAPGAPSDERVFTFVPHLDFVASGKFSFP